MHLIFIAIVAVLSILSGPAIAQDCYESSIQSPTPFMGNNGEIFKLTDGSIWEVKFEYEYLYEYYPSVIICPSKGKLAIDGKTLNVQKIAGPSAAPSQRATRGEAASEYIESSIDGEFEGWEGETIVKLINGQVWQQTEYHYHYHYAYGARVQIFRVNGQYKMQVDGIDKAIGVSRLK